MSFIHRAREEKSEITLALVRNRAKSGGIRIHKVTGNREDDLPETVNPRTVSHPTTNRG